MVLAPLPWAGVCKVLMMIVCITFLVPFTICLKVFVAETRREEAIALSTECQTLESPVLDP